MPASSFALANGTTTGGTTTYSLQSTEKAGASYIDTSSTLQEPRLLDVKHEIKPVGNSGNDRHTVSVKWSKVNAITGKVSTVSSTLTISVPRSSDFSDDDVIDIVSNCVGFMTETRAESMIDGITPNS